MRHFLLASIFLFGVFRLHAAFYVENEPGGSSPENWNDSTTWYPLGIPGSGDTVLIQYDTINITSLASVGYLILQGGAIKADTNLTIIHKLDFSAGIIRGKNNVIVMGQCNLMGGMKTLQSKLILHGKTFWNAGDIQLQYNPDEGGQANPCEGGEIYLMADTMRTTWNNTALHLYVHAIPECCIRMKGPTSFIKDGTGTVIFEGGDVGISTDTVLAAVDIDNGSLGETPCQIETQCGESGGGGGHGGGGGPSGDPGDDCDDNENAQPTASRRPQKGKINVKQNGKFYTYNAYDFLQGSAITGQGVFTLKNGFINYRSTIPLSVDSLSIVLGSILKGNGNITSNRIGINDATLTDSLTVHCKYLTIEKAYHSGNGVTTVDSTFNMKGISVGNTINRHIVLKKNGNWNTKKVSFSKKGKIKVEAGAKLNINTGSNGTFEYRHGAGPVIEVLGTLEQKGSAGSKLLYKTAIGATGGGYLQLGIGGNVEICSNCDIGTGGGGGNCFNCPQAGDDDDDDDGEPDGSITTDCGETLPNESIINELRGTVHVFDGGQLINDIGFTKFGNNTIIQGDGKITIKGNSFTTISASNVNNNVETIDKAGLKVKSGAKLKNNNLKLASSNARVFIGVDSLHDVEVNGGQLSFDSNVVCNKLKITGGKILGSGNITASGRVDIINYAKIYGNGILSSTDSIFVGEPLSVTDSLIIAKPIVAQGNMMIKHTLGFNGGIHIKKNNGLNSITIPANKELIIYPPGPQLVNADERLIVVDSMCNPFKIHGTIRKIGDQTTYLINGGLEIMDGGQVIVEKGNLKWGGIVNHGNGSIQIHDGAKVTLYATQGYFLNPLPIQTFPSNFSLTGAGTLKIEADAQAHFNSGSDFINLDSIQVYGGKAELKVDRKINLNTLNILSGTATLNDSSTIKNIYLTHETDSLRGNGKITNKYFNYKLGVLDGPGEMQVDSLLEMDPGSGSFRKINKTVKLYGIGHWLSGNTQGNGMFHLMGGSHLYLDNANNTHSAGMKIYPNASITKTIAGTNSLRGPSYLQGHINLPSLHNLEFYTNTSRWDGASFTGGGTVEIDVSHTANIVGQTNFTNCLLSQVSASSTVNDSIGNTFGKYTLTNGTFNGYANSSFISTVNVTGGTIRSTDTLIMKKETSLSTLNNTSHIKLGAVIQIDSIAYLSGWTSIDNESATSKGTIISKQTAILDIDPTQGSTSIIQPDLVNYGTIKKHGVNKVTQLKGLLTNYGTIHTYFNGSTNADANRLELINGKDNIFSSGAVIKGDGAFKVKDVSTSNKTKIVVE